MSKKSKLDDSKISSKNYCTKKGVERLVNEILDDRNDALSKRLIQIANESTIKLFQELKQDILRIESNLSLKLSTTEEKMKSLQKSMDESHKICLDEIRETFGKILVNVSEEKEKRSSTCKKILKRQETDYADLIAKVNENRAETQRALGDVTDDLKARSREYNSIKETVDDL